MASHVFHQLYYHLVWSTKRRAPLITENIRERVIRWVEDEAYKRGGFPIACNAMPDHLHLFVNLPPTVCVATFIGQVKGGSSHSFNQHFGEGPFFKWQDGYGAVTVRKGESAKVIRYIANQQELHVTGKTSRLLEKTETED